MDAKLPFSELQIPCDLITNLKKLLFFLFTKSFSHSQNQYQVVSNLLHTYYGSDDAKLLAQLYFFRTESLCSHESHLHFND